jgi:hypothetical protein
MQPSMWSCLKQDQLAAILDNDLEKENHAKEQSDLLDSHIAALEQSINLSGLDFF